jgi:hypothetical protein
MKLSIGSIALVALACAAVGVAAQTPKPDPAATITVIGCVEPAIQATPSTGKSDMKFVLTNAKAGKAGSNESPVGTSGSTSPSPASGTYRLEGNETSLTSEVGHQVEIVALVLEPDSAASSTTSATAAAQAPKLKVESVKMIAATCPAKP